jgi:hypothetical protein
VALDLDQPVTVDLAVGLVAYLKIEELGWPGENMTHVDSVRLMPPQAARTAIAQLACSHPSPAAPEVQQGKVEAERPASSVSGARDCRWSS